MIDSNVWNWLWERGIDLAGELPAEKFALFIPREVEIEVDAIPERAEKVPLIDYIRRSIEAGSIRTCSTFGFQLEGRGPQRRGGFGVGTFQSATERQFFALIRERFLIGQRECGSGLTANEGDAAVAAQSFVAVVLTHEARSKPGPLRIAADVGGKVLYLGDFEPSGQSLRNYVVAFESSP